MKPATAIIAAALLFFIYSTGYWAPVWAFVQGGDRAVVAGTSLLVGFILGKGL